MSWQTSLLVVIRFQFDFFYRANQALRSGRLARDLAHSRARHNIERASAIGSGKEMQSDSAACESVAGRVSVVTDASATQSGNTLETNLSRGYWQSTFDESLS